MTRCVIQINQEPYDVAEHYARKTPPMALPATPTMAVVEIVVATGRDPGGYEVVEEDAQGTWLCEPMSTTTLAGRALPLRDGQMFAVFPGSTFGGHSHRRVDRVQR